MQKSIRYKDYYNKVLGGWIGKCAGGILGAPIEGFKRFNDIPYSDDLFATNFANDDLDLQILWLDMLLKKGSKVREADFTQHWKEHVDFPWCEYGTATRNIKIGLDNPNTGQHNNWYWKGGMGSPIRSEIWGMVNPGRPEKAAFYAGIDSRLDHNGFSVHAEQYLSACASIAFFDHTMDSILKEGLQYIPSGSDCHKMVRQILKWNEAYDFDTVAGKIKSRYGDADFTASGMNVGFILLSLLHADNSFDFLMDALHMGHDSDCIVATGGALLGIVLGYKAIPDVWKKRVGNEILVSPEITGIHCPRTITELSDLTCQVGIHFALNDGSVQISELSSEHRISPPEKAYSLHTEVVSFPNPIDNRNAEFVLHYENHTKEAQNIRAEITSPYFKNKAIEAKVDALSQHSVKIELDGNETDFPKNSTKIPYAIQLTENGKTETHEKGFPYYGNWLFMGPFLEDDESLVPMNETYPDHGLPSLPSLPYMNHDKARPKTEFLSPATLEKIVSDHRVFDQPFHAEIIHPSTQKIDLADYFYGKGERTLYLYTEVRSKEDIKKWLAIGSGTYLTVWHNGNKVYQNEELKRAWPLAHIVELDLSKGKNTLLIRMDATLDDFTIELGLKEHNNKHPHQTQWETGLQFDVTHVP